MHLIKTDPQNALTTSQSPSLRHCCTIVCRIRATLLVKPYSHRNIYPMLSFSRFRERPDFKPGHSGRWQDFCCPHACLSSTRRRAEVTISWATRLDVWTAYRRAKICCQHYFVLGGILRSHFAPTLGTARGACGFTSRGAAKDSFHEWPIGRYTSCNEAGAEFESGYNRREDGIP